MNRPKSAWSALAFAALLGLTTPAILAAAPTPSPTAEVPTRAIAIVINGQPLAQDVAAPRIINGRVMVPVRVVFDALGVPVTRSGDTITGQLPTGTIVLPIGAPQAKVNGQDVRLDSPAVDLNGTTFVPLRFIADALGATATYDGRAQRVEIVSALVGRNVGEQSGPNGGIRIRGVVSEVDRNVAPPTVTVNERGAERTISMNSDAKIYVEDVTINSQLRGGLEDLRVGDALLVVLAKDGRVLELHDFFRSQSGTIAAVSPASFVLAGGIVVTPASSTELTLNGATAQIGDLQLGDYVTVRRNPETGELRQIIASRKGTATAAPAGDVSIADFTISTTRPLRAGETFDVLMHGTPHGRATFDIGNYVTDITMREDVPGAYRARFTIPDRFNLTDVPVYGHLAVGATQAPKATAPVQLSAATTPPQIVDIAPPGGQTVNTSRPNIYATFTSPSQVGINTSSVQLIVNGHDVTGSSTRSSSFITYAPGIDYPDGPVTVTVRVSDAAGNASTRSWSFAIKTR
jgi:hypothetical protein